MLANRSADTAAFVQTVEQSFSRDEPGELMRSPYRPSEKPIGRFVRHAAEHAIKEPQRVDPAHIMALASVA
jgi:hypothetical protein